DLLARMPDLNGLDPGEIDVVAANARGALAEVATLLDSQYGGIYVFAGQDSSNAPVPNPNQILNSGFFTGISGAVGALSSTGAITAMATDVGILGEQQSAMTARKTMLSDLTTVLTGQLSSARDVDMAVTLSNLTLTQTRLQASYQLISAANSMSLVKFLAPG